jgi:hypothetical protein
VTVTDEVPANAFSQVTAAGGTGWSCAPTAPVATPVTITCTRSTPSALAVDAAYPPITLTAQVVGDPPLGMIVNTAAVAGGGDGDTTNNSGSSTGSLTTRADLSC